MKRNQGSNSSSTAQTVDEHGSEDEVYDWEELEEDEDE